MTRSWGVACFAPRRMLAPVFWVLDCRESTVRWCSATPNRVRVIMKLFKRRAKPDEIKTEAITDSDHTDTETSTDKPARLRAGTDASPAPAGEVGGDAASDSGSAVFERLRSGLSRSRGQLSEGLASLVLGKKQLDPALLEALEEQLIMADLGSRPLSGCWSHSACDWVAASCLQRDGHVGLEGDAHRAAGRSGVSLSIEAHHPFVILVVGVNGAGKTTTIGKLAHRFKQQGHSVMLAAGDTFRAAAVEQLQAWGERNDVPVIAQHTGADSASVLFDALQAATARNVDLLIADTAGRLQNKSHLMDELSKVVRVMRKQDEAVPHETLLVLDAGTGQNASPRRWSLIRPSVSRASQ